MVSKMVIKKYGIFISIIAGLLFYFYDWWWLGSSNEFISWYPKLGLLLFIFSKILSILFLSVFLISVFHYLYVCYRNYSGLFYKYPIILFPLSYMLLSFVFKEHQPFSMLPMYSNLNNKTYVFYFTKNDILIPISDINQKTNGASLSHYYYNISDYKSLYPKDYCSGLNIEVVEEIGKILNVAPEINFCISCINADNKFQHKQHCYQF